MSQESVTSNDGTPIAYWRSGEGPPLVLVHGTSADHSRWKPVLPAFEEHFTVYAEERKVRFLDVAAGGFLELSEKNFVISVEAVREINKYGVVVDQSREKVAGSQPLDTDVVSQPPYQRDIYDYYSRSPVAEAAWTRERGLGVSRTQSVSLHVHSNEEGGMRRDGCLSDQDPAGRRRLGDSGTGGPNRG